MTSILLVHLQQCWGNRSRETCQDTVNIGQHYLKNNKSNLHYSKKAWVREIFKNYDELVVCWCGVLVCYRWYKAARVNHWPRRVLSTWTKTTDRWGLVWKLGSRTGSESTGISINNHRIPESMQVYKKNMPVYYFDNPLYVDIIKKKLPNF